VSGAIVAVACFPAMTVAALSLRRRSRRQRWAEEPYQDPPGWWTDADP
jgi:hypothetical protein